MINQELLFSIASSIGVFVGLWATGVFLEKSIIKMGTHRQYNPAVLSLLAVGIKRIFVLMGLISAAGSFGIDIRGLLAGLGLTGFALGFALKDLLANTIAGIFILLYRPFKLGQEIKIQSNSKSIDQGTVTAIDLRYTTIDNAEEIILIPNSVIFTNSISLIK
ncbi:MAG: small conductance mechanosensitive channel [Alteromonas naphthalenivorans]|jgi:small conductance mechanosensitive channel